MPPSKRAATHPGEVLQAEFLTPLGISQSALARHIGVYHFVVCDLVHGKRNVTPRIAVMLARALGTSPEFWMELQSAYDLSVLARTSEGKRVHAIPPMQNAGR